MPHAQPPPGRWRIDFLPPAAKELRRLDPPVRARILTFLDECVAPDPRSTGTALVGEHDLWRYRVGGYRVIATIHDETVTVTIVKLGSRGQVYRD